VTPPAADFLPAADWPHLRLRAQLLEKARGFFKDRGFLEVETPILSHDIVVDRHLDPFTTVLSPDPRRPHEGETLYLQTSPEFAMKRLLAAGGTAIYQITKAFRNGGERGRLHNPEFTMVEWYRVDDDLDAGMELLSDFAKELLGRGAAERVTYRQAFEQCFGVDPHAAAIETLLSAARGRAIDVPVSLSRDRDGLLNLLMSERIEPQLGCKCPIIVYDYPASQAALARVRDDGGPVAERFELYVDGIELANGYHELLDAEVLRQRSRSVNDERARDGKPRLPEKSRLLAAMETGLPACSGTALGYDRLVMVAARASAIDQVIAFPIEFA
jgi:lysyl-tRNA synthetase class 2